MRCPHCGTPASCHEVDNILQWHCVDGCGAAGQTALNLTPVDTQIDAYLEAKHGTGQGDPLVEDEPPF